MFKTFVLALRIEAYSYLIVVVHSYRFVVSPPVCCDSVRCNTMCNDRIVWFALIRKYHSHSQLVSPFVCVPLLAQQGPTEGARSAKQKPKHTHTNGASDCGKYSSYQIVLVRHRGRPGTNPKVLRKKIASSCKRCHSHWFIQLFATVGRGLKRLTCD